MLLLSAAMLSSTPTANAADESALVGKPAPEIKLDLLDGGKFDLANYKGKNVLIVDFWATWCGPCRAAMPVLMDVAKEYQPKGVLYFAVDLREDKATIQKFLTAQKWNIKVPLDKTGKVADAYGVSGIPTMAIIDKQGVVREVHLGFSPTLKNDLKKSLDKLVTDKVALK